MNRREMVFGSVGVLAGFTLPVIERKRGEVNVYAVFSTGGQCNVDDCLTKESETIAALESRGWRILVTKIEADQMGRVLASRSCSLNDAEKERSDLFKPGPSLNDSVYGVVAMTIER